MGWKNFLYFRRPLRPEARGICHICHMVNPALLISRAEGCGPLDGANVHNDGMALICFVRGVEGRRAKHLTIEFYTVVDGVA